MDKKTKRKRFIGIIVRVSISAVLILALYYNIDFSFVLGEIAGMPLWFFLCIILEATIGLIIEVVKWRVLLPSISFGAYFRALLYGNFFTLALPGQLFGEAAKIVTLGRITGKYDQSISTVVIDKMTGFSALLILGLIGLLFSKADLPMAFTLISVIAMAAVLSVFITLRSTPVRDKIRNLLLAPKKLSQKLTGFCDSAADLLDTWREYLFKPALLLKSLSLGFLFNAVFLTLWTLACLLYNIPVSIIDLLWILTMVHVVQALPISLAGIGVRDASMVAMFALIGVSAESAEILAMILLIIIVFRAICGAVCILCDMVRKRPGEAANL